MSLKIYSALLIGLDPLLIEFEYDLTRNTNPNLNIIGMDQNSLSQLKTKIITSLKNTGINFPALGTITINASPSDIKKSGSFFDLPIAFGLAVFIKDIKKISKFLHETIFIGELSLMGEIKPVNGALAIAASLIKLNKHRMVMCHENAQECSIIPDIEIIAVSSLQELIDSFILKSPLPIYPKKPLHHEDYIHSLDYYDVRGQYQAKRALQIAAAGSHHIIMIGTPGSGKTMLAKRLPTIMPNIEMDEILETSKIYSVLGLLKQNKLIIHRPFRDPHHTISPSGLIGGGRLAQPGEISKAHNGILFLDEMTEMRQGILDLLRQPLEEGKIKISRMSGNAEFPASFLLIGATNPCPCGYLGSSTRECTCSPMMIEKYLKKLSGPLIDRIDLQVSVQSVDYESLSNTLKDKSSLDMRTEVLAAVDLQYKRFNRKKFNAQMTISEIEQYCILDSASQDLIKIAFNRLNLSMRSYHKILKVSRTIADLDKSDTIKTVHLKEAFSYRSLDKIIHRNS